MSEARRRIKAHHTGTQERHWPGKWRGCPFTQKGWQALTQAPHPGRPFPTPREGVTGLIHQCGPAGGSLCHLSQSTCLLQRGSEPAELSP